MSSILKPVLGSQLQYGHRLATGLVGLWLFNEGSGLKVFDLSGNGNTGVIGGTSPSWTAGKFGSVINLPGTDEHILVEPSPTLFCPSAMTLIIWINPITASYTSDEYFYCMYDHGGGKRTWAIGIESNGNIFKIITSTDGTAVETDETSTVVQTGWHQIAFVADNITTLWDFYYDGVYKETLDARAYADLGSFLTIGALSPTNSHFASQVDVASLYCRGLSASEIEKLYREPFCMFERDPIELWVGSVGAAAAGIVILRRRIGGY